MSAFNPIRRLGMTSLTLQVVCFLYFAGAVTAQNPVSLSIDVKPVKVKAGDKLTAHISASIGGGWHMYSVSQGGGGPFPTKITVVDGVIKGAGSVRGSAAKRAMDSNFGIITETYSGSAAFTVPLVVVASVQPGPTTVSVNVRYQVCNETTCLPPKTVALSAPVEIIAATAAVTSTETQPSPSPTPTPKNSNANVNPDSNSEVNANTAITAPVVTANTNSNSVSAASTDVRHANPLWNSLTTLITFGNCLW